MPIVRASRTVRPSRAMDAKWPPVAPSAAVSHRRIAATTYRSVAPVRPDVRTPTRSTVRSMPSIMETPVMQNALRHHLLPDRPHVVCRDHVGGHPSVEVVFRHTFLGETLVARGRAGDVGDHQ